MSSNKKRKLNGSSEPPNLSASAARKSLQNRILKRNTPSSGNQSPNSPTASIPASPVKDIALHLGAQDTIALGSRSSDPALFSVGTEEAFGDPEDDLRSSYIAYFLAPVCAHFVHRLTENCSLESRAESPEVLLETPVITLSTFKPSKTSVRELADNTLCLSLAPGERLVILGQCEISVQKGQITLLGTTLQPSKLRYRLFVTSSHSLPVIRCLATDLHRAEISIHQCETGLGRLKYLSPLFSRLWNDGSGPLGLENRSFSRLKKSSFQILFSQDGGQRGAYLHPIISAPEWNEALSKFSDYSEQKSQRILVCGPKSSGKSTFAKLLSNRLLSAVAESTTASSPKGHKLSGVALLDLDPGQPEYSAPGQLSLMHILQPNFGPPFSHPIPDGNSRIIRAHSIAAITPSMDPSLYMACALDLFAHYRNLLSIVPNCPLIINTTGWVLGTGLEILVDLINKIRPTEVIYMSQEGPGEVVESLRDAAKTSPVFTLPSQVSKYVTKTASHLRTMQAMSYFHIDPTGKEDLAWQAQPLTSIPPWEIRYSGENAGILGIICYGEQPLPDLLLESINGSLLAVVVVDDMAAIPGWQTNEQETMGEETNPEHDQAYAMNLGDTELRTLDDESLHMQRLEKPLIVRTPKEDLPYFNPSNAIFLDPKHSHCIGLALVRGIDISRRRLQISTPISPSVVEETNETGKSIVLVGGNFDTPGWAYTEELMQRQSLEKATKSQTDDMDVNEREETNDARSTENEKRSLGDEFKSAPWVERQENSQGRPVGSRVWRVRRDLGRSGD